jgi:hypothetical protein
MSHNSNSYVKRIRKKDAKDIPKLTELWKKQRVDSEPDIPNHDEAQTENCDQETTVPQVEDDSSDVDHDHDYEENTLPTKVDQRHFYSEKYESRYSWLYYSYQNRGYMCKFCEQFAKKPTPFSTGCSLGHHPTRLLDGHESSNVHKDAVSISTCTKTGEIHKLVHEKHLSASLSRKLLNRDVIKKLLRCANFMIKKRWALTDNFQDFVKFVANLGVDDLLTHVMTAPPNATYLSSTSVTELVEIISETIEVKLLESLRNAHQFTLLADESTDEAGREQFAIYARWDTTESKDTYLGIIHVTKTNSANLTAEIQSFFQAKGVSLTGLRFMAFDGANTMSGVNTGKT